jgi:hypothetical protein
MGNSIAEIIRSILGNAAYDWLKSNRGKVGATVSSLLLTLWAAIAEAPAWAWVLIFLAGFAIIFSIIDFLARRLHRPSVEITSGHGLEFLTRAAGGTARGGDSHAA